MNSRIFLFMGLIAGCCFAQERFNYGDMQHQIKANNIRAELVGSDHDINKPRVISLDEADRLYREDPKAFRKWMQEKWPAIHTSMQLCTKMATEAIKEKKEATALATK